MKKSFRIIFLSILVAVLNIVPAQAADTQAPVLVDWKLIDNSTDISAGDGTLRIQFSISDDSSIEMPITSLSSQTSTQQSGLVFPVLISKVGNISTYTAEAKINFGKAPGLWKWLIVPLRDNLGNTTMGFGPGGNWPVDVWVFDKDFTEAKHNAEMAKAAADLLVKQQAEAKAAAEKEAKAKAAAAEKAEQDKRAKDLADKAMSQVNAKFEYLKSKYPLVQLRVFQGTVDRFNLVWNAGLDSLGNFDLATNAENLMSQFKVFEAKNPLRSTITCLKGKTVRKVTAVSPKCPAGYKKK